MTKKPLIVANWKANKTVDEALAWLREFKEKLSRLKVEDPRFKESGEIKKLGNWEKRVEIVICPPFTALAPMKSAISHQPSAIKLGAQDISLFPDGLYTGEVTARMLSGLVDYVLVGHSERRKRFGETTKIVGQKVKMAQKAGITPIVCAASFEEIPEVMNDGCLIYEPPSAISQAGVYRPDTPENAQKILTQWKSKLGRKTLRFLYGGSVNPRNVARFLAQPDIDGVVVGHASLNPVTFVNLLANVLS